MPDLSKAIAPCSRLRLVQEKAELAFFPTGITRAPDNNSTGYNDDDNVGGYNDDVSGGDDDDVYDGAPDDSVSGYCDDV